MQRYVRFKDDGFGSNNPSEEVHHDIVKAHGGANKNIGPLVSIGIGKSDLRRLASRKGHFCELWANSQAVR